jgi:dienelactone hydrolase
MKEKSVNNIIKYKNRRINLKPFFEGFPYFGFSLFDRHELLYYFKRDSGINLYATRLHSNPDLANGKRVSNLDFSTFSCMNLEYHAWSNSLVYIGDECNDEQLNLYSLDLTTGNRRQLTHEEYLYGASLYNDERKIAFVARKKNGASYSSSLKTMDLSTFEIVKLVEDDPKWTYTWTSFLHHKISGSLVFKVLHQQDRNEHNLIMVDTETMKSEILLPENVKRVEFDLLKEWLDPDTFLYLSDEDGFTNVFSYDISRRSFKQLTFFKKPVHNAILRTVNGKQKLIIMIDDPVQTRLVILDPVSGAQIIDELLDGKWTLVNKAKTRLFATQISHSEPFRIWELTLDEHSKTAQLRKDDFLHYPSNILNKIVHGSAEAVEYQTFDEDASSGKPRMIHSFLLIPKRLPRKKEDRRAIITAFYGGENIFSTEYQIFLQAGFYVLSPAVRGSWGFGADFYALNNRDLGGNEIIDLIYGARYLQARFGLKEQQIGLEGGSHGGYCAMRALTFPPKVNNREESFKFGFAIASYGISNIIDYHATCNIPDWVLQKAGDPATEQDKLMDRSPVSHAHRATGPLLLVHGANDNRVPVAQSRQMAQAMQRTGKPYSYIEIPGQGHGWSGLNENRVYYKAVFEFLNAI